MFCPKCSQQQISDDTRFCSRCGFQLNVIKALLIEDNLPSASNAEAPTIDRSLRKRDLTFGALFMFIFALAVAAITVDMPSSHSARIILLVIAWLVLTLLINIKPIIQYFSQADLSVKDDSKTKSFSDFSTKIKQAALPSAYSTPAEDLIMPAVNTAEMHSPLSVTERTTNLLEKKEF